MKRISTLILTALLTLLVTGCRHKDLSYDSTGRVSIRVVFDWKNAPDATPESMALMMFGSESGRPIRYIFDNRFGGSIDIPFDTYNGLCINSDNTDWALLRNTADIETFELYTADADMLEASGISTAAVPHARDAADERVAKTPGMTWSDRQDDIDLPPTLTDKTITLYPEEAVCHYIVDVYDVDNLDALTGSAVDGTISGMAEGYLHGKRTTTSATVTMPFVMTASQEEHSLHSEFLTFGECPGYTGSHTLTLYMILKDGAKRAYNFDVTDQVNKAPDPRHVHIIIHGLPLPDPIDGSGGLHPNVNNWDAVYIDLKM